MSQYADQDLDADLEQDSIVKELIHRSAEALYSSMAAMDRTLPAMAESVAGCVLNEGKVFACGDRSGAVLAGQFVTGLLNRLEHERPSLPAFNLGSDAATINAISNDANFAEVYERQLLAFGQPGDVLLILCSEDHAGALAGAVRGAHQRDMRIVVVTGERENDLTALLTSEDLQLQLPINHAAQLAEVQMVVINALLQLVELHIFGLE